VTNLRGDSEMLCSAKMALVHQMSAMKVAPYERFSSELSTIVYLAMDCIAAKG
jgi:hypothetical protein